MRHLILPALLLCAPAAEGQALFDAIRGQYGSATDPATSCAANPHQLDFTTSPPHAVMTWGQPKDDGVGRPRTYERYDIEDYDAGTMTLEADGDFRPDRAGGLLWVLQITQDPPGYCWRRPDWPQVRCAEQQLRCENATS